LAVRTNFFERGSSVSENPTCVSVPGMSRSCVRGARAALAAALLFGVACFGMSACAAAIDDLHCGKSGQNCGDGDDGPDADKTDAGITVVDPKSACAMQSVHAMHGPAKTVDVIFVIDNSSSMNEEISAVRENINENFAAIVQASAVDLRVIMLSRYGVDGANICVEPPLAGAPCEAGLFATNSETYFHYNDEIDSGDAFCRILQSFDHGDAEGRAPNGFRDWLRADSLKAFVVITDDSAMCTYGKGKQQLVFGGVGSDPFEDALRFHSALLAKSPEQFGVPPDIKYQFFSIVGLSPNASPATPVFPYEEVRTQKCDTAPSAGLSYQALSIVTDALRYPVCEGRTFDAVFRVLAQSVIQASKTDCVFELPQLPPEQTLDLPTVNLEYQPSSGKARRFAQVGASDACKNDGSFYIVDEHIELCPQACTLVQADPKPEVNIHYGCLAGPD
jgi:hypothetical protein